MKTSVKPWRAVVDQMKALKGTLCLTLIPVALLFGVMILLKWKLGVHFGFLTRDPGDILRQTPVASFPFFREGVLDPPIYMSAVAYLDYILWGATAAVCLFSYSILRRDKQSAVPPSFLLPAAVLSLLLLADDCLRFHEIIFPKYLHLSEHLPYVIYGLLVLYFLIRYRKTILQTEYLLLLFSLACFGLSEISDRLTDISRVYSRIPGATLVEDGAKLLGIVFWFAYFARFSRLRILDRLGAAEPDPVDGPKTGT
jgi:hypothetical protein